MPQYSSDPVWVRNLSLENQDVRKYRKAISVAVRFADAPGVLDTLEGRVPFNAGDAIITGPQGEQWPVGRSRFEQIYSPVSGYPGRYQKSSPVLAKRMDCLFHVRLDDGITQLIGKPGDWAVMSIDGGMGVVDAQIFEQTYEALS